MSKSNDLSLKEETKSSKASSASPRLKLDQLEENCYVLHQNEPSEASKDPNEASLFKNVLFREEPDIQIQELEEAGEGFNPFSESIYSGKTPRSGESINFNNLISSDLLKRIEEGSPIKTKRTKKNNESNFSEEEEEGRTKEKEQHSLFYKNNPQWKIASENLNYIQEKEPNNEGNYAMPKNSNEEYSEPSRKPSNLKAFNVNSYQNNKNFNENYSNNFNYEDLSPSTLGALGRFPSGNTQASNYNNFTEYHAANFDQFKDGQRFSEYSAESQGNFRTPFNSSENINNYSPKNTQPHLTFEEFLKLKYQNRTPSHQGKFNNNNSSNGKNVNTNPLNAYHKKDSQYDDYDYCSNSTHSTVSKKLSPFEDIAFYPKNFYPQTPNIKSYSLSRNENDNFRRTENMPGGNTLNFNKFSQQSPQILPKTHNIQNMQNAQNLKSLKNLEKLNECSFYSNFGTGNYIGTRSNNGVNGMNNVNNGNNLNNLNKFNMTHTNSNQNGVKGFNPSPSHDINYLNSISRSTTLPNMVYNPQTQTTAPSNTPNDDYLKSPLSLNLNINKIKKNANINNLGSLSSNLTKLSNNITGLNNLSSLTNNLPNFENMAELNAFIEQSKDGGPEFDYEKGTPPTPQNTPQYKNLQNVKPGWICSSCKNFNYESIYLFNLVRVKCNRCGKPQLKHNLTTKIFRNLESPNINHISKNNLSPNELNQKLCNYNINYDDVSRNAINNDFCKNLINPLNVNIDYDFNLSNEKSANNSSESTSPKNFPVEKENTTNKANSADSKKKKKPFVERVGDWVCIKCKNLNFSFRVVCNRCQLAKTESEKLFEQYMKNLMNYVKINELLQNQILTNQSLIAGGNTKTRPKAMSKGNLYSPDEPTNSNCVLFNGEDYFDEEPEEAPRRNIPK